MTGFILLAMFERVLKFVLVTWFFRQNTPTCSSPKQRVSILQPILSGDPTLWDCLRANLQAQTSHQVEWIWLVDDNDTAGISGCNALIEQFADRNILLVLLPPPPDGINPKMLKLIEGEKVAQGDVIAVLDDDTMLPHHGLDTCLAALQTRGVGLVFGLPYYRNFSNVWSALVSSFVNANSLLTYVPYTFLMQPFTINGMFYAMPRTCLQAIGGFNGLETQLCDDYSIASRVRQHGYKLCQTPLLHAISTHVDSFAAYRRLLNRWFIFPQVSIMSSASWSQLLVFYSMIVLPMFFPLVVTLTGVVWPSLLPLALLYWAVNVVTVWAVNRRYFGSASAWLLPVQLLVPFHILWALVAPKEILWRGHRIRVLPSNQIHFVQRKTDTL